MRLPKITLAWLKKKNACQSGYEYCEKVKITNPIMLIRRLIEDDHNDWANWLIVRFMDRKQKIAYAIYAAELVLHIFEEKYPGDLRPRKAIEAARKYLECDSYENKMAADAAAYAAAKAAYYATCYAAIIAANSAYYAASVTYNFAANATYRTAANAAYYATNNAATIAASNKSKTETQGKILAYGIELLVKDKQ